MGRVVAREMAEMQKMENLNQKLIQLIPLRYRPNSVWKKKKTETKNEKKKFCVCAHVKNCLQSKYWENNFRFSIVSSLQTVLQHSSEEVISTH